MKALFGGGKKKPVVQVKDPMETIGKLEAQIENIDKRGKILENKIKALKNEALTKKRNKDNRGAVHALKQSKMQEKEMGKLDGMKILLEQQKMAIESSSFDNQVYQGLQESHQTIQKLNQ